ncbi:MAG TPA: hypothetical protein DIW77_11895 [Chromatiaceae bacterium]|nr:hypothetical protein [Chromatiaceae bacterium]
MVALWAGCRNVDAGREDKPGGLLLDSNRLDPQPTRAATLSSTAVSDVAARCESRQSYRNRLPMKHPRQVSPLLRRPSQGHSISRRKRALAWFGSLALLATGFADADCDIQDIIPASTSTSVLAITTTQDENDGGTSGTGRSLRDGILIANSRPGRHHRLQLEAGAVYRLTLSGADPLGYSGDLDLRNNAIVTIETVGEGAPAIIDASDLFPRETVLSLLGGARLILRGVEVRGGYEVGLAKIGDGGGVFVGSGSRLGLYAAIVRDNQAGDGGGIYLGPGRDDSKLVMVQSSLLGNRSVGNRGGGGVMINEDGDGEIDVCIEDSLFEGNRAATAGGGLFAREGVVVDIARSQFNDNDVGVIGAAGPGGGAIHILGENSDPARLDIVASQFNGNLVDNADLGGGAIYAHRTRVYISNTSFVGNRLTGAQDASGAAIFATASSRLEVADSLFSANRNEVTASAGGAGGAILTFNQTDTLVRDSHFEDNQATGFGGALALVSNNTLTGLTFIDNHAGLYGGALRLQGTTDETFSEVQDCRFERNVSEGDGGAIHLRRGETRWSNIQLRDNRAAGSVLLALPTGDGGAISIDGGEHRFDDIRATGNHAEQDGGVFSVNAANALTSLTIRNGHFVNNRAEDDGGGIDMTSNTQGFGTLGLENISAEHNSAGDSGGFLRLLDGVQGSLRHSRLIGNGCGNRADPELEQGRGGALDVRASRLIAEDLILRNNSAAYGGGALRVGHGSLLPGTVRGRLLLINGDLRGNRSWLSDAGAVLADTSSDVQLVNVQMYGNLAALDGAAIYAAPRRKLRTEAKISLFDVTAVGNIADSNATGNGASALFAAPPGPQHGGQDWEDVPPVVEVYNSIITDTVSGAGTSVPDYAGAEPRVAEYSALGRIDDASGWGSATNLLNIDAGLTAACAGAQVPLPTSPLIDAGDNASLPNDDLDIDQDGDLTESLPLDALGQSRIAGATVDIGAIEAFESGTFAASDSDCDGLSDAWEQHWLGHLDASGRGDQDGDGATDAAEFLAGTDPTFAGQGVRMSFADGLDLASFPSPPPANLASCLAFLIELDDDGSGVMWRLDTDGWLQRCDPINQDDFPLTAGSGWYLRSSQPRTLIVPAADSCAEESLRPGMNLIGHPRPRPGLTCFDWLAANEFEPIRSIGGLDAKSGRWVSCARRADSADTTAVGTNFLILPGEGYRIFSDGYGQLARPGCG